jgi:hypothetical protein
MKTIKIIIPIILLLFITISSCEKKQKPATTDADGLPFATQTGANTFGCLIDGVPFSVSGAYSDWRYYGVEYTFSLDSILDITMKTINPFVEINIRGKINGNIPGNYLANKYLTPNISFASIDGGSIPGQGNYYIANDSIPLSTFVSVYTGDRILGGKENDGAIIAGTFEGEMQNSQGKKIKITKGRFDIARK